MWICIFYHPQGPRVSHNLCQSILQMSTNGNVSKCACNICSDMVKKETLSCKELSRVTKHGCITMNLKATAEKWRCTESWQRPKILLHPSNSPELAPSDYHIFWQLKDVLRGRRFASYGEVKVTDGIRKLVDRSNKYGEKTGDYVEKWQRICSCALSWIIGNNTLSLCFEYTHIFSYFYLLISCPTDILNISHAHYNRIGFIIAKEKEQTHQTKTKFHFLILWPSQQYGQVYWVWQRGTNSCLEFISLEEIEFKSWRTKKLLLLYKDIQMHPNIFGPLPRNATRAIEWRIFLFRDTSAILSNCCTYSCR